MTVAGLLSLPVIRVLGAVVSRPLGLDFSVVRRVGAGLLAFVMATSVIRAITPDSVVRDGGDFPAFCTCCSGR